MYKFLKHLEKNYGDLGLQFQDAIDMMKLLLEAHGEPEIHVTPVDNKLFRTIAKERLEYKNKLEQAQKIIEELTEK